MRSSTLYPGLSLRLLLVFGTWGLAQAETLFVQPGERIGDAILRARAGDVIEIASGGAYTENLRITKPLTLRGRGNPTLSGGGQGDVIRIVSPDVEIAGLVIRDSGDDLGAQNAGVYIQPGAHRAVVRNCQFAQVLFGLWIQEADGVRVEDNRIAGMREKFSSQRGNGIQLYNSQHAEILRNEVSFARDGIYVDVSHHARFIANRLHDLRYGTHYMNSYHNLWQGNASYRNVAGLALMEVRNIEVRDNLTWGNTEHGIMLRTIQDSRIENNITVDNGLGFFIYDAEYNQLRGNLVMNNRVGVHLWAGSYHNQVDGNDFINNDEQVRYVGSREVPWGQQRGNYWSNYLGWDSQDRGYGNTPFEASDLVDRLVSRYPFVKLLDSSPSLQTLKLVSRQFPVLRVPTIVDAQPAIAPHHRDWADIAAALQNGHPPTPASAPRNGKQTGKEEEKR